MNDDAASSESVVNTSTSSFRARLPLNILRLVLFGAAIYVLNYGIAKLEVLQNDPARWLKVIGPHQFATVSAFILIAIAIVLAIFSRPIVSGSSWIWNFVSRKKRAPTRLDEAILVCGCFLILFESFMLFDIIGGFA